MPKADQYIVQNNIVLAFESRGKQYKMKVLVEDGMILLYEMQDNVENDLKVWFLGDRDGYTGEHRIIEVEPTVKPKKKRSKKKKKIT